jgi:hypothetical protein
LAVEFAWQPPVKDVPQVAVPMPMLHFKKYAPFSQMNTCRPNQPDNSDFRPKKKLVTIEMRSIHAKYGHGMAAFH